MRIIFLIDTLCRGGKERRCVQLIKGLNNLGLNDIHLVLFDNLIEYPEIHNLNVILYDLKRKSPKDIDVFKKIYKIIDNLNPDIVFSWSIMGSFYLNFIRIVRKFNYISGYVADVESFKKFSLANIARLMSFFISNYIVGNSNIGLTTYKVPINKRVLIYNGFDLERLNNIIDPSVVRNQLGIQTKYIVCMVATVYKAKDYQTYIDAAKLIIKERNDVTFLAIGKGPLLNFYCNQLTTKNEKKHINFIGNIDYVESVINACNISVLTTRSEGISNVILESMMFGKPVLSTNTGGTPEILVDSVTGYLLRPSSVGDLMSKVNLLLDNEELCFSMGKKGKEIATEKFSLESMSQSYLALFRKLNE